MRIFATSDLHTDFSANEAWLASLSIDDYSEDALIVAGDIAHRIDRVKSTLENLQQRFQSVFFVPGNHELWVRGEAGDSLDKFERIMVLCERMGVLTHGQLCGEWWVAPLFSWYCARFDADSRGDVSALRAWGDFRYCRWPQELGELDLFFAGLNKEQTPPESARVVTFSHFVPRIELLPSQARLRFKGLPKVAGSPELEGQLRALGAEVHVFGHSHIPWDETIDGVRYLQQPLAYPQERHGREYAFAQIV